MQIDLINCAEVETTSQVTLFEHVEYVYRTHSIKRAFVGFMTT
jgi:hypothetical protein